MKATFEQRLETGEVMNPTDICRKTAPDSMFKAFEVKCAYHKQFEEGWYGWNRAKQKKETVRKATIRWRKVKTVKGLAGHQKVTGFYSE